MKALFFTREYPPEVYGGAGVHVEYLSQFMAQQISVEVRCFGEQDALDQNPTVDGYAYEAEGFDLAQPELKGLLQTLNTNVRMNVHPIDADVIHCHTWYSHFAGIMAKLLYGKPLIVTTHSLEPLRPWKREQLGRGYDASSWIEKTAIEMADAVIAVSEGTRTDVIEHFDVNPDKLSVIYNGIDLAQYQKVKSTDVLDKYNIDPNSPFVLFVGRITRQKGIIHLVNAIEHINPDVQVVLCAGAPDTPEIAQEMKSAVSEVKKHRNNIIWIQEMLDKASVIQLYSHATVFCCPSIYEPFGIINVEAMACNCPVVASAVGGITEVVVPNETGILIPLEQQKTAPFEPVYPDQFAKDLATGINQLVDQPDLAKKMGDAGRKRVEQYFDWKQIANQTIELYQKTIDNHG